MRYRLLREEYRVFWKYVLENKFVLGSCEKLLGKKWCFNGDYLNECRLVWWCCRDEGGRDRVRDRGGSILGWENSICIDLSLEW